MKVKLSDEDVELYNSRLSKTVNYIIMQKLMSVSIKSILSSVDVKLTASNSSYTDGRNIYISHLHAKLNPKMLAFVICHEACHILFLHIIRSKKFDKMKYNYATDYWINSLLATYACLQLPVWKLESGVEVKCLKHKINEIHKRYSEDEIYDDLDANPNSGEGNQFDDHDWDLGEGDVDRAESKVSIIKNSLRGATGSTNDPIDRIISNIKVSKSTWYMELDYILGSVCMSDIRYNYNRDNRRLASSEFFNPDRASHSNTKPKALVVFDTSGSISNECISVFKGEATKFVEKVEITLISVDTAVFNPVVCETVDDLLQYVPKGGGGTDFNPAFKYANKHGPFDVIIYFTDGCGNFNGSIFPQYQSKTYWLIKDGISKYVDNYGKIVILD